MFPRLGAFEVSTILTNKNGGMESILFFSKMMSGLWPHTRDLGIKIGSFFEEIQDENNLGSIKLKFQTTGKRLK